MRSRTPSLAMAAAALAALVAGLAWFLTPEVTQVSQDFVIIGWPNIKGVPLMIVAIVLWAVAIRLWPRRSAPRPT